MQTLNYSNPNNEILIKAELYQYFSFTERGADPGSGSPGGACPGPPDIPRAP